MSFNEIIPKLFQGSMPPEGWELRDHGFDVLVLCAEEHQPSAEKFPGVDVIHAPNDDSGKTPTIAEIHRAMTAAKQVATHVKNGKTVIVTCAMGINRSGLVTAMALHLITGKSGQECAKRVQRKRPGSLRNRAFVELLSRLPPR